MDFISLYNVVKSEYLDTFNAKSVMAWKELWEMIILIEWIETNAAS